MTANEKMPGDDGSATVAAWWQVLPGLVDGPLDAARLAGLLYELLPGASKVEVQLEGRESAHGETGTDGEAIGVDVVAGGQPRGWLGARLPRERLAEGKAVLGVAAGLLGQRLALADLSGWRLRATELVTAGEAVGGLVHAVNNHLNSMLMQAMVLQLRAEGEVASRLAAICQEGKLAAARLRPVQALRPWPRDREKADLAAVVRGVLAGNPELARQVRVRLPGEPVVVQASPAGAERLVWLVLRVGLRCLPGGASAALEVQGPLLALELPIQGEPASEGVALPPETLPGVGELEREAIHWLARQLAVRLEMEQAGGNLAWRVYWPA